MRQPNLRTIDNRRDYGEIRHRALGFLDHRLYALVFVEIVGGIRVISFRKANKREV
ncbi:BrnT family toxin [Methylobacter tundripaludum]|uniref:BrnT family toxin n=1 Tax=Methylobacter tundripaludum TaxID=173365 RepID=UPI002158A00A|nr:BrnT family toxin [Methylobacter tundripaludum]